MPGTTKITLKSIANTAGRVSAWKIAGEPLE